MTMQMIDYHMRAAGTQLARLEQTGDPAYAIVAQTHALLALALVTKESHDALPAAPGPVIVDGPGEMDAFLAARARVGGRAVLMDADAEVYTLLWDYPHPLHLRRADGSMVEMAEDLMQSGEFYPVKVLDWTSPYPGEGLAEGDGE